MITFAQSLPHVMNNRQNVEHRIKQCENRQTSSTFSSSQSQSPIPQPPKPLPPPGVSTYHPPMLWDLPPHLDSSITPEASMAFTPSAHGVDSHCKATKPSHDISNADSLTQVVSWNYCKAAVGPDLDLPQEISKNI